MEGNEHELMLACVISGTLFSVVGSASFALLWAVNWRPWRIYRFGSLLENGRDSYKGPSWELYVVFSLCLPG
uniref:Uncharacterized protein n=1 Tax=Solanum lycopersicum TaxID=4081 RepID=A0A3Q7JE80_SOLLC